MRILHIDFYAIFAYTILEVIVMKGLTKPLSLNDPNWDIWELAVQIRGMQSQLRGFEQELQYKYDQQMNALEGLLKLSDYLMLMVNHIYDKRVGKDSTPEDR